jgi:hypothetical protein
MINDQEWNILSCRPFGKLAATIIKARGSSSAAALGCNAAIDHMRDGRSGF